MVSSTNPTILRPLQLCNLSGMLTLMRLPLAILFPFVLDRPHLALLVYFAAVLSDALDGPVARWRGTTSQIGAFADGWLDKIFHIQAAWSMAVLEIIPGWWMWLWFSRELIQGLAVPWYVHRYMQGSVPPNAPSGIGRLTAILLAIAFVPSILGYRAVAFPLTVVVGVLGTCTALGYLKREFEDLRRPR